MIDTDFSWPLRVYHNHPRHLRSIVFVVYFFASYLMKLPVAGLYETLLYCKGDFKLFLSPIIIVFCQGFDQLRRS